MVDVAIAGGGLSGCLAALVLARNRPDLEILLIEREPDLGGKHVWSFFDSDVNQRDLWVLEGLPIKRWPMHEVRFPARHRILNIGYNSLSSEGLNAAVRRQLKPDQMLLGRSIERLETDTVYLEGGERVAASAVVDARGPRPMPGLELAWQKFVGHLYRFDQGHGVERPVIMDATVDQADGYRFVYSLPFSGTEMLIEDTFYSTSPALDDPAVAGDIASAAEAIGPAELVSSERGVLPILLGGSIETMWGSGARVARLGLGGGFFHPTTGYSFPDAIANAALLADQRAFSSAGLYELFHSRAEAQWKARRFYVLLNRMLFHGASPADRYRVLEHFYRLPEPVIQRFYAGALTISDKARILSGRPPVPVLRALKAVFGRAS